MDARRYARGAKRRIFRHLASDPDAVDRVALIEAFHCLYYDSRETTWGQTFWRGHRVFKCPLDLWVYQEILVETRPDLLVETGTFGGASAYYFASVFDLLGHGEVLTIDIDEQPDRPSHRRITYIHGSSLGAETVAAVRQRAHRAQRVMVVLDSDHTRDHVLKELEAFAPLVTPGCYLVVEDTNVNGHPVMPAFGPGPLEALDRFLETTDAFEVDRSREKLLLTFNPSGFLRRRGGEAP
jgi:cephalosporin hydroxylase